MIAAVVEPKLLVYSSDSTYRTDVVAASRSLFRPSERNIVNGFSESRSIFFFFFFLNLYLPSACDCLDYIVTRLVP